ncbi:MerR family transcriptional regulator [Nocardioides hwasunensis]|uniref:MerR family transcriptional regulator n=1 Tax=Nocardioides hwasunensis TaxID=397258 RepID=A0ABR8MK33_9ACTN|nr:MerR family transcriptional regulator [Nocardioides hwasunensis]MBD3915127.1 MerR family transcriptional regulator [Nocardioides hwasunensis]
MYTVSRAAELTGVPSGTLRKWEQRYGVVAPRRTPGNYRMYDDEAVRRLTVMRSLVEAGWTAREAARHVTEDAAAAAVELPRPGESVPAVRTDELIACAQDFDVPRLERCLTEAFARHDVVSVVDEWLLPSLVELGRAWQRGLVSVAGEHFVSAAVHRRLAQSFQTMSSAPSGGPRVVVGLARGSHHELGVLAFAMVLRSRGVAVTYLGRDLPIEAWVGTVRLISPEAVVLAVPTLEDLPAVREAAGALAPLTTVLVGGAHQDSVEGAEPLGHRAGAAADALATRLGAVS